MAVWLVVYGTVLGISLHVGISSTYISSLYACTSLSWFQWPPRIYICISKTGRPVEVHVTKRGRDMPMEKKEKKKKKKKKSNRAQKQSMIHSPEVLIEEYLRQNELRIQHSTLFSAWHGRIWNQIQPGWRPRRPGFDPGDIPNLRMIKDIRSQRTWRSNK